MKRLAVWSLLLVAALAPAALPAAAAETAAAEVAADLFCAAPPASAAVAPEAELAIELAPPIICEIGCVNDQYCRRDRDCTAAPGGRCNLVCPNNGCCVY